MMMMMIIILMLIIIIILVVVVVVINNPITCKWHHDGEGGGLSQCLVPPMNRAGAFGQS